MTRDQLPLMDDSAAVRRYMTDALRLDLIGPRTTDAALQHERLLRAPSRWYLTGFLVPANAPEEQRAQDIEEEFDEPIEPLHGSDDATTPDRSSGKRNFLPSSMGLSILVDDETRFLDVVVSWGDYSPEVDDALSPATEQEASAVGESDYGPERDPTAARYAPWIRAPRQESVTVDLSDHQAGVPAPFSVPDSAGLSVVCLVRPTTVHTVDGNLSVRAVSVFVVNRRQPRQRTDDQDLAFAFQVEMSVEADRPLVAQANVRDLNSDDWDERLADLHFRDVSEYAVGHNVSTSSEIAHGRCCRVRTEWMPQSIVHQTEPSWIEDVEFGMECLGSVVDGRTAIRMLSPLVTQYREWIDGQTEAARVLGGQRTVVAEELVSRARRAADRIQAGIDLLAVPDVLEAFRIANRAMAASGRRRQALEEARRPREVTPPTWRPFQLAYILMNLRGIADPTHIERRIVDLLFFPTGGGKTEAYLGLAAFTLVLRRLRTPDPGYRGLSVLMRYTLRLLTLDQLSRAAAMICALELEREKCPERLGEWPFEIALWVGRAATPNYMGSRGDRRNTTARAKTLRFASDTSREPPLPLRECPWCGRPFNKYSFRLHPNTDQPQNLIVRCAARRCDFGPKRHLPIVAVDEPIYERVPAFMIATADKFAALPWSGETARFFAGGDQANPKPPDLIIQDELHLISGPLGTMVGLYETAIDHLCARQVGDQVVRPKIVASTATVRVASKQIRALFNREHTEIFPVPGVDRRRSFFAEQTPEGDDAGRLYLGISAAGRSPKVVFLRSMTTLMAAAQAAWDQFGDASEPNPADPYMTAVAYFNALRELGSARRIVEDEISSRLPTYDTRRRLSEKVGLFANRRIAGEPVELTSRVGTAYVAEAKRRLGLNFDSGQRVDVALATNMISVGLDITRLGLMVVSGQPKTTAEYIQATSRVGRDPLRPGLVVTLLNIHKPRDRSHYERFVNYHESFYRHVEPSSVTPFSPRALDRGLPAVTVALARLGIAQLNSTLLAGEVEHHAIETKAIARAVGDRARSHAEGLPDDFGDHVRNRVQSLIDDWSSLAHEANQGGVAFGYARRDPGVSTPLLREMIDPDRGMLNDTQLRFRAPRSLRDVEPGVLLAIKTPDGMDMS